MADKTEIIFRTALVYASYKGKESNISDNLLKNMFNDLCLLSEEYSFDYEQELKNILKKKSVEKCLFFSAPKEREELRADLELLKNEELIEILLDK